MGIRYPEGRIGRPREIGGRHVRKEQEGRSEGGPEGLRQAHQARAGYGPEDAGAQGLVQGDREGAGQVALDGERRGVVAQVRRRAQAQARRARRRRHRPVGSLPAPRSCARTRCSSRPGAGSTPTSPPRRRGLRPSGTACAGGCRPSRWRRATAGRWTCRPRPSTAGSRRATTA